MPHPHRRLINNLKAIIPKGSGDGVVSPREVNMPNRGQLETAVAAKFETAAKDERSIALRARMQASLDAGKCGASILSFPGTLSTKSEGTRRRALLVGINYRESSQPLRGCVDDARRMKKLLTDVFGFVDDPRCLSLITDEPSADGTVLSATRENVLNGMRWLVDGAASGDTLFFHFSGHGDQIADTTNTEVDGMNETILPSDFASKGMIVDDEIFDILAKDLPAGVRLIAIMDCCHSGSAMDLAHYYDQGKWENLSPKTSAADVTLISGCLDHQMSGDAQLACGAAGGALTLTLLDSLLDNPFGHSFESLLNDSTRQLSDQKINQRPYLSSSTKFNPSKKMFGLDSEKVVTV